MGEMHGGAEKEIACLVRGHRLAGDRHNGQLHSLGRTGFCCAVLWDLTQEELSLSLHKYKAKPRMRTSRSGGLKEAICGGHEADAPRSRI